MAPVSGPQSRVPFYLALLVAFHVLIIITKFAHLWIFALFYCEICRCGGPYGREGRPSPACPTARFTDTKVNQCALHSYPLSIFRIFGHNPSPLLFRASVKGCQWPLLFREDYPLHDECEKMMGAPTSTFHQGQRLAPQQSPNVRVQSLP